MKERFAGVVRALKPHTLAVELLSICIVPVRDERSPCTPAKTA